MIKKIFWLGLGVTIGVIAVRKLSQAQQSIGPAGLNRAVGRLSDSVHDFADTVRFGMVQREGELRTALGLDEKN
ncbi:conserved hypothetical protein [Renibacterium salmoninarum ATCC 33209]|uniref:Secreted protein n=1 Tax=Renibacterium salmoninarum (strain ATCC 33209 / DSM 20767 / JCM 11484 / NBRC 15589 / NCIMB 2235) TaxID=288705 RepID=A9WSC5_RENSM|nr:hypothetical protein [Renibacterium salmoninarum]ABY23713.1 conserved hypothetical protein [Renibacterium salmoninarum ATCC 33209]